MREQHKHKTLHINFLYSKSIPSPAKHNKKSSFYPVSQSWGTMISSTPHSTLLLSTVVIQLKSNRWGLIHWQASASKSVIHSQGRERESLCWLFSSAHFLNESIPFWNLWKHTTQLVWPHTLPLHTHRSSDSSCGFPATPTLSFSISLAVARQLGSGEVLWVELKKLHTSSCLQHLHMQVHLITVATESALVWKVERLRDLKH